MHAKNVIFLVILSSYSKTDTYNSFTMKKNLNTEKDKENSQNFRIHNSPANIFFRIFITDILS